MLLSKDEFEKMIGYQAFGEIASIESSPFITSLVRGDYVLVLAAQNQEVNYTLRLVTDEFFLRR